MNSTGGGATVSPVAYGDIIFASNVPDPAGGNHKNRRVVVITPNAELAAGYQICDSFSKRRVPRPRGLAAGPDRESAQLRLFLDNLKHSNLIGTSRRHFVDHTNQAQVEHVLQG